MGKNKIIIPFNKPFIGNEEKKEVLKTLASGWLTAGPKVKLFEENLSSYFGCKYVRALSSCTVSLRIGLASVGVGKGDEVITTPFTFCATSNAIINNGAKPVFVDINKDTFNIDPDAIEQKINSRTKAIVVMHHGGLPCDMDKISAIAKKHHLGVIEDAAHAIGAKYKGRKIGSISDITCFSFHAAKNITTGEGGAIATNSSNIMKSINKLYFHGIDRQSWQRNKKGRSGWGYSVVYPGFKANMTDLAASIGIHQLKRIKFFAAKRELIVGLYNKSFKGNPYIDLQRSEYDIQHANHLYTVLLKVEKLKINRDVFIERLKDAGIAVSVHFIPLYRHKVYGKFVSVIDKKNFNNTEYVYKRIISLPLYPSLTIKNVKYIIAMVNAIISKNRK